MTNPPTTTQTQDLAGGPAAPDHAKTLHWSTISDTYDNITKPHSGTVADLYATLEAWQRRSSQSSAKGGVAIIGARFTVGTHTGKNAADYPGDQRWRLLTRVQDCTLLMLDIDGATCSVEAARSPWAEVCRIDWSTHSHGVPSKPGLRMRLLMPYARHVSDQEHRVIYAWAVDRMTKAGVDKMDLGTKDPTRLMYGPGSVSRESLREPWLCFADGPFLDPDNLPGGGSVGELLAEIDAAREAKEAAREAERVEREREAQRRIAERGVREAFTKAEDESGLICPTAQLYLPDLDPKRVLAWADRIANKLVSDIATSTAGDRHYTARDAALFFGNVLAGLDELGACLSAETKERVSWASEVSGIEGRVRDMEAEAVSVGDNDPTRARAVQWGVDQGRAQPHLPDYRLKSQFRPSHIKAKDQKVVSLPPPVSPPATTTPTPIEDSGKGEGGGGATITQIQHQDPQARVFAALESVVAVVEAEGDDSILTLTTWADALGVVAEVWPSLPAGGKTPPSVLLGALGPQPTDRIVTWQRRAERAVATIERRHTKAGWRNDDDKAADFLRAATGGDERVVAELAAEEEPWRVALAWVARAEEGEREARAAVLRSVLSEFGKFIPAEKAKAEVKKALPEMASTMPKGFASAKKGEGEGEAKGKAEGGADLVPIHSVWPDAPCPKGCVIPAGYFIADGKVCTSKWDDDVVVMSRPVVVVSRARNEAGKESMRLAWPRDGRWVVVTVPRGEVADKNKMLKYSGDGCDIHSGTAGAVVAWLAAFEAANEARFIKGRVSAQMGWHGEGAERGFLFGSSWIDAKGVIHRADPTQPGEAGAGWAFAPEGEAEATDAAGFSVTRGTLAGWLEVVALAKNYPAAVFALCVGFAAPLVKLLGHRNILADFAGPAGCGKTTLLGLVASAWGDPDEVEGRIMKSWGATAYSIETMAETVNNLPLFLNDSNKGDKLITGKAAYTLTEGVSKSRGAKDGGRVVERRWRTAVLSSGEAKLVDYAAEADAGVRHRVIQIHGKPWGAENEHTPKIHKGIRRHYGHAGAIYLSYLAANRESQGEEWAQRWENWGNRYHVKGGGESGINRLGEDFALISVAADLVHKALEIPWDIEHTHQCIWDVWASLQSGERAMSAAEKALRSVYSWAVSRQHEFDGQRQSDLPPPAWAGAWRGGDNWKDLRILPERLRPILEAGGFKMDTLLGEWAALGWIKKQGGKHTCVTKIEGIDDRCVTILRSAIDALIGDDVED